MADKTGLHKEHLLLQFVHQTVSTNRPENCPSLCKDMSGCHKLCDMSVAIEWVISLFAAF
jgi:hypothetical protein